MTGLSAARPSGMVIGRSQIRLNCAQMTGKLENGFRNGATSQLPTIRPELGRQRNGSMRTLGCGYARPGLVQLRKKRCPHWYVARPSEDFSSGHADEAQRKPISRSVEDRVAR